MLWGFMATRTPLVLMMGLAVSVLALPMVSQAASHNHEAHHQHHAVAKPKMAQTEATRAYEAAMDTMLLPGDVEQFRVPAVTLPITLKLDITYDIFLDDSEDGEGDF